MPGSPGLRAINEDAADPASDGAAKDKALVREVAGVKSESSGDVTPSARNAIGSVGGSRPASDPDLSEAGDGEDWKDLSTGLFVDGLAGDVGVG